MKHFKTTLALTVFASAGLLSACNDSGGGGGNGGGSDNGGADNGGADNGGGGSKMRIAGDPAELDGRGRWGSLVISGYGRVNNGDSNNQTTTEAVPDGVTRWFGGTDNADSSGTIEYVILAETGEPFRPDEEVQGLTIEGAGSGTTISHLQVTNSDDDGIEWFGGEANADHIVVQGQSDDALDMDLGFQGTIQYALVRMGANYGDRGIESDNNGSNFGATPKTSPVIANLTILGNAGNGGTADENTTVLHREGFGGQVYNSYYGDDTLAGGAFDLGCLDIDDEVDGDLQYGNVVFQCTAGELVDDDDTFQDDFKALGSPSYDVQVTSTSTIDAGTLAITPESTTGNDFSAELTAAGLDATDFVGAVDPNDATAWWDGWTLRQSGIEGNLPGGDFHPLEAEIRDGSLAPAADNACADKGQGLQAAEDVEIFGVTFPVCVIRDGDLDGDYTLTNDHIYLLDGTVQVGNGDVESAHDKGTVREDRLTLEAGTQIFGISDTDPSLVITRGSRINANGTAALPIIMGAVDVE